MKMDSLDSLTYGGVRGRENLFNFPSYSITQNQKQTIFIAAKRQKVRKLYGIFQQRSKRIADPCYRSWSRLRHLGRYQSSGGIW